MACAEPEAPAPPELVAAEQDAQRGEHLALRNDMLLALRDKLGPSYDIEPPGLASADIAAGKALYATHCLRCHGETGRGGPEARALSPRPSDLSHPGKATFFSDAGRLEIVRTGFTGSAMQGYAAGQGAGADLSEEQILDLYAYVRTLRRPAQPGRELRERPGDGVIEREGAGAD